MSLPYPPPITFTVVVPEDGQISGTSPNNHTKLLGLIQNAISDQGIPAAAYDVTLQQRRSWSELDCLKHYLRDREESQVTIEALWSELMAINVQHKHAAGIVYRTYVTHFRSNAPEFG